MIALQREKSTIWVSNIACPVSRQAARSPTFNRIAYDAKMNRSLGTGPLGRPNRWDATIAFVITCGPGVQDRRSHGHGAARRRAGLGGRQELIRRCRGSAQYARRGSPAAQAPTIWLRGYGIADDVIQAMRPKSIHWKHGGRAILMASRALAARSLAWRLSEGLWPHPLGEGQGRSPLAGRYVRPQLAGYWGRGGFQCPRQYSFDHRRERRQNLGIKISQLDNAKEVQLRDRLPQGVACFAATTSITPNSSRDGTRTATHSSVSSCGAPSASKLSPR